MTIDGIPPVEIKPPAWPLSISAGEEARRIINSELAAVRSVCTHVLEREQGEPAYLRELECLRLLNLLIEPRRASPAVDAYCRILERALQEHGTETES
ncbi:MAG: hypothetical protein JXR96_26975 [Deltaproteobacteria bacterium]|nr:hypothetical protein [Deltaproteobacteria bacterium]